MVLVWMVFVSGCASINPGTVVSGFDGDYVTSNQTTRATQRVAGVAIDCAPMTESLFIRVRNGVASGYFHRDENYSFRTLVQRNGALTAVIPIDSYYQYQSTSLLPTSNLLLTFETHLSVAANKGVITIADRRFGFKGCATEVELFSL